MATIAASARTPRAWLAIAGLAAAASGCAQLERGATAQPAAPATTLPRLRVALAAGEPTVTIGGGAALRISHPDGTPAGRLGAGTAATASLRDGRVALRLPGGVELVLDAATVAPEDTGYVRVAGRDYRGVVDLVRTGAGLVASNHLTVEDYLLGVVNAEMGRRAANELAALRAQAVISRTVAVRAIGRDPSRGYDLLATVADQAYLGVGAELDQGREAVEATRGVVLAWDGRVIDAFFHSTCGGRTAEPTEIFAGAGGRAYLRSVSDQAPDGRSWCAISPRYRWREEWVGSAIETILGRDAAANGATGRGRVRDVVVTARGPTGRVQAITVRHADGDREVRGANQVRQVLRPEGGGLLRSSQFALTATPGGEGLARLVADGQGAGHGVGMCQWGAVGRARAGAGWQAILAAYFPGAEPARLY